MARKQTTVETVAYHRNGVGGDPFVVAIVNDPEHGRMLVTDFHPSDPESASDDTLYTVAVVNLDQAHQGNIHMHPLVNADGITVPDTGGNAWRGDDLGRAYRPLIRQALEEQQAAMDAAIALANEKV